MKKYAWILALAMVSVLVCSSLALAQEKAVAAKKTEKGEKQIVIKLPEGAGGMMPGCQMMGQMGQTMGQMGQWPACMMMGPMAGCGMGQMQGCGMGCCAMGGRGAGMAGCGMAGTGPRMTWTQKAGGMGCGMGLMGAGAGMGCGMTCGPMGWGMLGGMSKHGCAGSYLKCADALELTQKQMGDLKAICTAAKKAMIRKQADIKVAQAELHEIMSEDVLDFAKAKAKISEIADLKASVQTDRLANIQKAQRILTAEQLKQWKAQCAGMCGAGQQVKKCITIMKGQPGVEMGDDEEDIEVEMEEEEGDN
jgi:Spy/CpxP family protein refolding chaperone